MRKIFFGVLFIHLNFNLNLGGYIINLIPNFVGYILLVQGLKEIMNETKVEVFEKTIPFCIGMGIYTGIIYLMNLFQISAYVWLTVILEIANFAVSFYILYSIIGVIRNIEIRYMIELNQAALYSIWKWMLINQIIFYVFLSFFGILVLLCTIIYLVLTILFLIKLYTTKNLYEAFLLDNKQLQMK